MGEFLVLIVVIFGVCHLTAGIGDEDIRCVAKSCDDAECTQVPDKCRSNETNPGVYLLSPDICNCCDYCLVNLVLGDACSIGDPSNARHTTICGPALTCVPSEEGATDGTCEKMSTPCALEQQDYDERRENGILGTMETRPICDDDGLYSSYKCIPGQTCYCLRPDGTRIFGDANFNTISNYMPCGCSQKYYDAVDILGRELHPHEHFRCTSDGNYDAVQSINEQCLCVDVEDGAPTYPDRGLVDLKDISNETLPCYTSTKVGEYYKKCEGEYMKVLKEVEEKKNESSYQIVWGYNFPNCDLDGTYSAVRENRTHKYCVNKEGNTLTAVDKSDNTLKPLIESMDCKCARANVIMATSEKPDCLQNGNYNPIQCRRGICRCVDSDGNQKCSAKTKQCEVEESQKSTLTC